MPSMPPGSELDGVDVNELVVALGDERVLWALRERHGWTEDDLASRIGLLRKRLTAGIEHLPRS